MSTSGPAWPVGMTLVRTTPEFDEATVPAGLLGDHRVAPGVWGRLVVRAGALGFVFEGRPERIVSAGGEVAIPPDVTHHVRIVGPVRFVVEFHRPVGAPAPAPTLDGMDSTDWDARYREAELVWSAGPNMFVEQCCGDLVPGRAIDLAAGEGRNAIWLAERGWDTTAVDFSEVAIDKARQIAERRGVPLTAVVADLDTYLPTTSGYDLVVVAYLQLPASQLAPILGRAAAAVAPGGVLFMINHDLANLDGGYGGPQSADVLTTPGQVVAALGDDLVIERAEVVERHVQTADGERVALDTLVLAQRMA